MRLFLFRWIFIATGCLWLAASVRGQSALPDSAQGAGDRAIAFYHVYLGEQSALYNGIAHIPYAPSLVGFPYFQSIDIVKGSVRYDHIIYTDIPMRYDQVLGQLIINDKDAFQICLSSLRVQEFTIHDHHFINTPSGAPVAGFYDLLCSGKLTVLARREKKINESIVGTEIIHSIEETDYFYVVKDGHYHELGSERALLELMDDKKKELKQYIKSNRIKFKKNHEQAIVLITRYYNQLFI